MDRDLHSLAALPAGLATPPLHRHKHPPSNRTCMRLFSYMYCVLFLFFLWSSTLNPTLKYIGNSIKERTLPEMQRLPLHLN